MLLALMTACGYHTTGNNAPRLPTDLHTIYVQGIQNGSQTYRIGQTFTEALVRELRERTNYRIITTNDGTADAVVSGIITSVYIAPLTYDSATGRVSTSLVAVTMNARLASMDGKGAVEQSQLPVSRAVPGIDRRWPAFSRKRRRRCNA